MKKEELSKFYSFYTEEEILNIQEEIKCFPLVKVFYIILDRS